MSTDGWSLGRIAVKRRGRAVFIVCLGLLLLLGLPAVGQAQGPSNAYTVTPLVSDIPGMGAPVVDPNLINGWGIAAGPTTPWWVSDNGNDTSTLYTGAGAVVPRVFDVAGAPTGIVFNTSTEFLVGGFPARFLFATESGTVLGWSNLPPGVTTATPEIDRSDVGAVYKGLAIGSVGASPYLYATDFKNGRIDVFDGGFALQTWAGAFVDPRLPKGYGPFGIQALDDRLFVTFAKQNPPSTDEMAGQGLGFVDEFNMDGTFVARVATRGLLNAPWGVAMAPSDFGRFSGCLLVGNFGDGHINAYAQNPKGVWTPQGTLRMGNGKPVFVDGLWGIGFGNGGLSGPTSTLYFAAGPGDESHGLFGSITAQ